MTAWIGQHKPGQLHAPAFGHLPVLLADEIVDAGLPSLSGIERADALVDFRAQRTQLLDVREQCPSDLFLVLGRQALNFGNGLFKCFDHEANIPNRSTEDRGSRDIGQASKVSGVLPINFTSVAYGHHQHHEPLVLDGGDNTIIANAVAPKSFPIAG